MIRNLKMLALAISALLVLGAMGASMATASEFHSESGSTEIKGEQTSEFDEWSFGVGVVKCGEETGSGSLSGATAETFTETPTYSECVGPLGVAWVVDGNGCNFIWAAATVDLVCPAGKVVEFTSPGCVVTMAAQKNMNGVVYDNKAGPPKDVEGTLNANNVVFEEHNKGFFPTCKKNTVLQFNGVYKRSATFKGMAGGKQVGFWRE